MREVPDLIPFVGEWEPYEERIYQAFLDSFVRADVRFRGLRVKAQFRPATRGKGYSFWHVVSTAPHPANRNEAERVPDLRRCERIRWIAWAIEMAESGDGVRSWLNRRGGETRVVIWLEDYDYVVILAARKGYFILKTAYSGIKPHQRRRFEAEFEEFTKARKD